MITDDVHTQYLQKAISLAVKSVHEGGGPFGAVIVREGKIIAEAWNQVTLNHDPSAHAEVAAIRKAGIALGYPHIKDCILYSSCEPCPMCLAATMWARIPKVFFAASHDEAARAGFADTHIAEQLYGQPRPVALEKGFLTQVNVASATLPFDTWLARADRVEY
ncbi:MAG TPA: tRNA-specific adenosine deaminase [Pseudohongiella sp.]|nr:tRNA-specific adenosine deaminase [Pseudohongiella sp.]HBX37054.1 tRNA-specific adenosine deaminase [Pseudohongiella sp.]|tara:strand:+ start:3521 stop:4009 length:489 start_codon:yes stop_codon:yes gene_type:complete